MLTVSITDFTNGEPAKITTIEATRVASYSQGTVVWTNGEPAQFYSRYDHEVRVTPREAGVAPSPQPGADELSAVARLDKAWHDLVEDIQMGSYADQLEGAARLRALRQELGLKPVTIRQP